MREALWTLLTVTLVGCGRDHAASIGPSTHVPEASAPRDMDASRAEAAGRKPDAHVPDSARAASDASIEATVRHDAAAPPGTLLTAPQVYSYGGPVVARPLLTAITFADDPRASQLEQFVASIGSNSPWSSVLSQYGVGPISATPPIRIPTSPGPTVVDSSTGGHSDIHDFFASLLGLGDAGEIDASLSDAGLPAPSANSIYVLFYPGGTAVTLDGANNTYHLNTTVGGMTIVYAVIPYTSIDAGAPASAVTAASSHEIAEAATDPFTLTMPAFGFVDAQYLAWTREKPAGMIETELADLCQGFSDADYQPADFPFRLQHIFSNSAAATGHNPCQPRAADEAYFVAIPEPSDTDSTPAGNVPEVHAEAGIPKRVAIHVTSDIPTTGPWTLSSTIGTGTECTFDPPQAEVGTPVTMTFTPSSLDVSPPTSFTIVATQASVVNAWPVIVEVTTP